MDNIEFTVVTAESLTDEQIREEMNAFDGERGGADPHPLCLACISALGLPDDSTPQSIADARAYVAAAINARAGKESPMSDAERMEALRAFVAGYHHGARFADSEEGSGIGYLAEQAFNRWYNDPRVVAARNARAKGV